ncbi:helicase-exonuclease AddAB subunit AddA [bacterium]|nr:helicase-exonuclease AddAB subunit AddA [bacterium]
MSEIKWTAAQQSALDVRGQNVLVNAGAGAGKTATLVERVLRLLKDPENSVSIENMLIVTFTRAAASEMKERLGKKLRDEIARLRWEGADHKTIRHLQNQLTILPRAPISTLHSFCLALLHESSAEIDLAPDFDVMAEEEAILLREEVIDEALADVLDDPEEGPVLFQILEQLSPADGLEMIGKTTGSIISFLEALTDPHAFVFERVLPFYEEAANDTIPFEDSEAGKRISKWVLEPLRTIVSAMSSLRRAAGLDSLSANWAKKYWQAIADLESQLATLMTNIDPAQPLPDFKQMLKLPRRSGLTKNASAGDAVLHAASASLKETVEEAKKALEMLEPDVSMNDMRAQVASTMPFVRLMLDRLGLRLIDELLARHKEQRRLTYGHLERLALQLLSSKDDAPTAAAKRMQERFEYVLVDEFQDVNELQATLLKCVSRPASEAEQGNQFVVGDVKQSIYGFRQADPTQFQSLYDRYRDYAPDVLASPGARIDLQENFRSAPALLRELNRFFESLFCPRIGSVLYDHRHTFVPGRAESGSQATRLEVHLLEQTAADHDDEAEETAATDELLLYDSYEKEAHYVAQTILSLDVPRRDIAILLRSSSGYATKLVEAFKLHGIEYFTQESIGFLTQQEVVDVLSLLHVIDNPYRDVQLIGCLRGPAGEWTEDELAMLRLHDRKGRLFDNLKAIAADSEHPLQSRSADFLVRLRTWQSAARRESMGDFFARLYDELDLRERLATLPNGDQRRLNLQYLQDRAVQFDSFRRTGLGRFLEFIEDLIQRGEDLGQPSAAPPESDVVRIMTIHKSKGLEFPVVIVPFIGKRLNFQDARADVVWDREAGFAVRYLPERRYGESRRSIAREFLVDAMLDRARSEELRLLYVAMTRAKERLFLIGSAKNVWSKIQGHLPLPAVTQPDGEGDTAAANSVMDWTLQALRGREEFQAIDRDNPIGPTGGDGLHVRIVDVPMAAVPSSGEVAGSRESDQLDGLKAATPMLLTMIERLRGIQMRATDGAVRAKLSVTEAKRAYEAIHYEDNPPARRPGSDAEPPPPPVPPDWLPPFMSGTAPAAGRRAGTLTHRLCALLDLVAVRDGRAVADELARLTEAGYFSPEEAAILRTDEVQLFFEEPIGQRILACAERVRHEAPFTIGVPAGDLHDGFEAADEPMIFQGIVDLYFEDAEGRLVLLDFKTDWCGKHGEKLPELERAYTPQLVLYQVGLERALRRPVDEAWIYFLRAGQACRMPSPGAEKDWLEYLRAGACLPTE